MLPLPFLFLVGAGFLLAVVLACSPVGRRLATLPFAALVGFHAFRFPLELVLHNWYHGGTLPVQMTYAGTRLMERIESEEAWGLSLCENPLLAKAGSRPYTTLRSINEQAGKECVCKSVKTAGD